MRRSRMYCAANGSGFEFAEGGHGTIEDCVVTAVSNQCLVVGTSSPLFRRCKFSGGKWGVAAFKQGKPTLEDCEISGAAIAGVTVKSEADPVLRRCRIVDNSKRGVNVYEGGKGVFEDCVVERNTPVGVEAFRQGAPVFRRCKISRNEFGAYIYDGARATFIDCDLSGNRCGAWYEFEAEAVKMEGGRTQ